MDKGLFVTCDFVRTVYAVIKEALLWYMDNGIDKGYSYSSMKNGKYCT